jgi:8-oxo-dGTP pyrophosphatase MutT (NUDIX family)
VTPPGGSLARPDAPAAAVPVPIRSASTVVLARDGDHGDRPLEVLLLRRRLDSGFVPGAHVFPGGALDPDDHHVVAPEGSLLTAPDAARALGVDDPPAALAHWVAALRETFEECGALLACRPGGALVDPTLDPDLAHRLAGHRRSVDRGERRFADVLAEEGLVPALDHVRYLARWITPGGAPRRYDTRFFVALAPAGQEIAPDGQETTEATWLTPRKALDLHDAGRIDLILPTRRTLELLARFATAADLLDALPARPDGRHVDEPGGGWRIPLAGDHPRPAVARPGDRP